MGHTNYHFVGASSQIRVSKGRRLSASFHDTKCNLNGVLSSLILSRFHIGDSQTLETYLRSFTSLYCQGESHQRTLDQKVPPIELPAHIMSAFQTSSVDARHASSNSVNSVYSGMQDRKRVPTSGSAYSFNRPGISVPPSVAATPHAAFSPNGAGSPQSVATNGPLSPVLQPNAGSSGLDGAVGFTYHPLCLKFVELMLTI
jgi:hypothetical protein